MSYPGNFIVIQDGVVTNYYARYALGTLYNFIGPKQAVRFAEIGEPENWINDCSESGFLLDFDRKHAIVFGSKYDDGNQKSDAVALGIDNAIDRSTSEYLEHAKQWWPDWELGWGDTDEFMTYLSKHSIEHNLE